MKQNLPTINFLLDRSEQPSELRRIRDYVAVLNTLTSHVRAIIPAHLCETTRVVYVEKHRLTLESYGLRQKMALICVMPEILKKMRTHLPNLKDIDIVVSPASLAPPSPPAPCRTLSSESASMIECVAAMAPPELRKALERLARCHKQ